MKQIKETIVALVLIVIAFIVSTPQPEPNAIKFEFKSSVLYGVSSLSTNIDERVYWLKIANAQTYPRYEVTDIGYEDETQSGGNVNIGITVLDEFGRLCFGCRVRFNTTDGQNEAIQTVINGYTDFPQTGDSSFSPGPPPGRGESGPYYIEVAGVASDRVTGMGLPLKRHVVYLLRFQKVLSGGATPTIVITATPHPSSTPVPGGLTEDRVRQIWLEEFNKYKFGIIITRTNAQ